MTTVTIAVEGVPAPQGSHKHVGNGRLVESSKRLAPWRRAVAAATRASMGTRPPFDGAVIVRMAFVMPRPVSTPKRQPTPPAIKRPDLDKLLRGATDAIATGGAVLDDSQIIEHWATKRIAEIGESPGVVIEITALSGYTNHHQKMPQRGREAAQMTTRKETQP